MGNNNQRLMWPDITKTIGLYLMILGHGGLYGTENIQQLIYSFHMPLFFIMSGIFFKQGNLKKTTIALLIPYLTMNILMLLWSLYINKDSFIFWINRHIPAILLGLGYNTDKYIPVCTPMWFFYVLYLEHLIMNMIFKFPILKKPYFSIILFNVVFIFVILILKKNNIDTLFPIDSTLLAFPFFSIGLLLKQTLLEDWSSNKSLIILFLMLPLLLISNFFNGRIDINTALIGNNIFLMIFSGLTGTLLLIAFSKYIEKKISNIKIINWKKYSLGGSIIVGLNLLIITITKKILIFVYPGFKLNFITGIFISVAVMLFCSLLITFCLRYCPILIGRKKCN